MPLNREQISLITDIIGTNGITATVDQTNGADDWSITIDQTWLQNYIDTNVTAVALTPADEARVAAIETLLGITTTTTPGGGTGVTNKFITMTGTPSTTVGLTWKIISGDGLTLLSKSLSVAIGASAENVLKMLSNSINTSTTAMKYLDTVTYNATETRVDFAFKTANPTHTLTITGVTGTGVSFSVTQ